MKHDQSEHDYKSAVLLFQAKNLKLDFLFEKIIGGVYYFLLDTCGSYT